MTYNIMHQKLLNINNVLKKEFEQELLEINPKAMLCYQSQYSKFTLSLYTYNTNRLNLEYIETEHLLLINELPPDEKIIKLAHNITKFIINNP